MNAHAKISPKATRVAEFPAERVRDVSVLAYMDRLGPGESEKMIAKDGDNGEQLRERAAAYDGLTRAYMRAMGVA